MISFPDGLLARLDDYARRRGKTRSGVLQEAAERELRADVHNQRREISAAARTTSFTKSFSCAWTLTVGPATERQ